MPNGKAYASTEGRSMQFQEELKNQEPRNAAETSEEARKSRGKRRHPRADMGEGAAGVRTHYHEQQVDESLAR
jgi:hypothetical protein